MNHPANPDEVILTTVGFDIGSSTSHLLFSEVVLRRSEGSLSSKFVVVERRTVWSSPVVLTPYDAQGLIDQGALEAFMDQQYLDAGLTADDIETGAVILTGNALLRDNSRVVSEVLARHSGRLVCATAGHDFEARLAAQGSGAVALCLESGRRVLNVDIGGGTTKFALVVDGQVDDTAALAWGARLVSWEPDRCIRQLDPGLAALAAGLGISLTAGSAMSADAEDRLGEEIAARITEFVIGGQTSGGPDLVLAPARPGWQFDVITFSGGVSEYLRDHPVVDVGDLGSSIGGSLKRRWSSDSMPPVLLEQGAGIRATVVGAGQYSAQVSGSTIHVGRPGDLPLNSVPVVRPRIGTAIGDARLVEHAVSEALDRDGVRSGSTFPALGFNWDGPPEYSRLRSLAAGIAAALRGRDVGGSVLIAVDQDIGQSLGRILVEEFGVPFGVICVDGVDLGEFDYLDVGVVLEPSGVVPLVVRTLLFPATTN